MCSLKRGKRSLNKMLRTALFIVAAIGYAIIINLLKPQLSGLLGDSGAGHWIQVALSIGPLVALSGLAVQAMQGRHRPNESSKRESWTNRNELLWTGRLSLKQSFWCGYIPYAMFAAIGGRYLVSLVNKTETRELKWEIGIAILLIALVGLAMRGVWRSGDLYDGRRRWVTWSRIAMLIGAIAICLISFF